MKQALLVIDVQEFFFRDKDNMIYNDLLLTENINKLIDSFRKAKEPVIFIRHTDSEEFIKNSNEWQLYSKLNVKTDDFIIDKYSPDSFYKTELLKILETENISSIIITGMQTEYCVDTTCRSAFGKGIKTVLVQDAHSTFDNRFMKANETIKYHNEIIGGCFATLKNTDEILEERNHK